jgi:zinc protease
VQDFYNSKLPAYLIFALILLMRISNQGYMNRFLCCFVHIFLPACIVSGLYGQEISYKTEYAVDAGGYRYEYVAGDPTATRIYTLRNGLKVYLSRNEIEPGIQTMMAFNAGAAQDPESHTGLAHYLEHLLFKGTSQIGTLDWAKEKPLLDTLAEMFERYGAITDAEARYKYYAEIDSVSQLAAQYGIAGEFTQLLLSIGATGINAATFMDRTAYWSRIPANELERWAEIHKMRFREFVPRYFHTELETVYEEFNSYDDNDFSRAAIELDRLLFPGHPYGEKTNLGTAEHLKNPSIFAIQRFFDRHYRPDNAAVCLSGDLDYDKTIALIDRYFGDWLPKTTSRPDVDPTLALPELNGPVSREIFGSHQEFLQLGYRMPGVRDGRGIMLARLIDVLLYSNDPRSGLLVFNLLDKRKIQEISTDILPRKEYSSLVMNIFPVEGQSLEEARNLILSQVELIKTGQFEEWMIGAGARILQNHHIASVEQNFGRAFALADAAYSGLPWEYHVGFYDEMKRITKQELMDFAAGWLAESSCATVFKRTGARQDRRQISKPVISPVALNAGKSSEFGKTVLGIPTEPLQARFFNLEEDIKSGMLGKHVPFCYVPNRNDDRFWLLYTFDMSPKRDPRLRLALEYLKLTGTSNHSSEEFRKELLKIGCTFFVNEFLGNIQFFLSGQEPEFDKALKLVEEFIAHMQPDQAALDQAIAKLTAERELEKKNKFVLLRQAIKDYLEYGENSPYKSRLQESRMKAIRAEDLTLWIQSWFGYEHHVYYCGRRPMERVVENLSAYRAASQPLKAFPQVKAVKISPEKNRIFWFDYDMSQAEMLLATNSVEYDPRLQSRFLMYERYFGNNILFSEIRESRALAYSVSLNYTRPEYKNDEFGLEIFAGTQADKLPETMEAILSLIRDMPESESTFNTVRQGYLQTLESLRFHNFRLLTEHISHRKRGLKQSIYEILYHDIKPMKLRDLVQFQKEYVQGRPFHIGILGSRNKIDFKALEKFGEVTELKVEDLFGN